MDVYEYSTPLPRVTIILQGKKITIKKKETNSLEKVLQNEDRLPDRKAKISFNHFHLIFYRL